MKTSMKTNTGTIKHIKEHNKSNWENYMISVHNIRFKKHSGKGIISGDAKITVVLFIFIFTALSHLKDNSLTS